MQTQTKKLLIATHNAGKLSELAELLAGIPLEVFSLADFAAIDEIDETGLTFEQNAKLKAQGYSLQTGLAALADDSGLEVKALDNRPGVLSARYGGPDTNFSEKMAKLIEELDKTGDPVRRARFVCSIAVADSSGRILLSSEGVCHGRIAPEPRGLGGFDYDPLFIPDGYNLTFGEMPETVKRSNSHRFRAFEQIIPFLRDFASV